MVTKSKTSDRGATRRYLVKCENCSFERTADGRGEATDVGNDHRRETEHDVVAVEIPPSIG